MKHSDTDVLNLIGPRIGGKFGRRLTCAVSAGSNSIAARPGTVERRCPLRACKGKSRRKLGLWTCPCSSGLSIDIPLSIWVLRFAGSKSSSSQVSDQI